MSWHGHVYMFVMGNNSGLGFNKCCCYILAYKLDYG